jgi:hypothetical protein
MCENKQRLERRCAMLDAENLAGTFIAFLLNCGRTVERTILLATALLKLADDYKLPPL